MCILCKEIQNLHIRHCLSSNWHEAELNFSFGEEVVHRQKYLAYGSYEFLIDVGSSLGLWLGLSVFGIVDLGVEMARLIKEIHMKRFKKGATQVLI